MSKTVTGIYKGPLQAVSMEGSDYVLMHGATVTVPDCEYVQNLLSSGVLVPVAPALPVPPTPKAAKVASTPE